MHNKFKQFIINSFKDNYDIISKYDSKIISNIRNSSIEKFEQKGLPDKTLDNWKGTDFSNTLEQDYKILFKPQPYNPIDTYFECKVHNFDTYSFALLNGWYQHKNAPLTTFPDGTIVGSLFEARKKYQDIVEKHIAKYSVDEKNPMCDLNNAFINDGLFVYIPENVHPSKPLQLISLINSDENLFIQSRNLIIVEKNSSLKLVHCDDTIKFKKTFINTVTEIVIAENSNVEYIKLENKDNESTLINSVYVNQLDNSSFLSNTITFNAGTYRNNTIVNIEGENCNSNVYGLYLVDKNQIIDNYVWIKHLKPNSTSRQLFKGIIDDSAKSTFNGHILVSRDAQKTQAYQSNKNIALTDEAEINSKPFLEIYADDVKCSHGSIIGQLDMQTMFYLRSRGICERNAKMLLLYAFAIEIANFIKIEPLYKQIEIMIEKRLNGELSICDKCVLHCSDETQLDFKIDLSKF